MTSATVYFRSGGLTRYFAVYINSEVKKQQNLRKMGLYKVYEEYQLLSKPLLYFAKDSFSFSVFVGFFICN